MSHTTGMITYYAFLWTAVAGAAVSVAVYLIFTLRQLIVTARELEAFLKKANGEMDKVQHVTAAVANVAGAVSGGMGRTWMALAGLAYQAVKDFRRRKETVPAGEGGDDERE